MHVKKWWNPNKICSLVDRIIPTPISWIWWYTMVSQMSLVKIGERVSGNFLCFLYTFLCTIGGSHYAFGKFSWSIDKYYGQSLTLTYADQQFCDISYDALRQVILHLLIFLFLNNKWKWYTFRKEQHLMLLYLKH